MTALDTKLRHLPSFLKTHSPILDSTNCVQYLKTRCKGCLLCSITESVIYLGTNICSKRYLGAFITAPLFFDSLKIQFEKQRLRRVNGAE